MDPTYQEIIRRRLELPLHEGPDKTLTLEEAVRRHVEPGDTLYFGAAHGRSKVSPSTTTRRPNHEEPKHNGPPRPAPPIGWPALFPSFRRQ